MFRQDYLLSKLKAFAGFVTALNWLVVFFFTGCSVPLLAADHLPGYKAITVITPAAPPTLFNHTAELVQLSEDDQTAEDEGTDESTPQHSASLFACLTQQYLFAALQTGLKSRAASFQPDALQRSPVPLFILHHSWRSHLV